ncbi:DUF4395 domain-containing protein [Nocardia uniformis]|uniref:DUF4395 domain-containing protein n=1 Tax=Nocardia uniformis TaxID=53432 RepID=A0A849CHU5_9NOCA|nr:DUF4395 domain-containing protein [Nocardia uniformis]NNH75629.1 DUF4395 domain-containing protein [Nocardia uniformis]
MSQPNPTITQPVGTRIPSGQVDVRGPRFAAWVTTAVLALVLILANFSLTAAAVLLTAQAVVFALGAWQGPSRSPYGLIYQNLVLPRIGPAPELEPVAPLRFAQLVGLVFAVLGVIGFASSSSVAGAVFTGFALFAAFLNAAFGICLGCKLYPLVTRFLPKAVPNNPNPTA